MKKISTSGLVAVGVYALFSIWIFHEVSICTGMFCEAGIVVTILPWILFFDYGLDKSIFGVKLNISSDFWYWFFVLLNVLILYFLFAFIQRKLKK